jgi:hypothetical protein
VNVDAILARIDTEHAPTHEEMGFLLPELERRKVLIADAPGHCCGSKRIACFYQFRGKQFLWVCAHIGYGQAGKVKVPALAVPTAVLPVGLVAITRCRQCGHGWALTLDPERTSITSNKLPPPIWAEVAG